mmetsp:Transcript_18317/g.30701  ORF Transcript_18317/g.30701 Transcript_18317/m.30701 type:complete len:217 (+) Transcript_18317:241-891(+)|eukprot:CAMPEP_0174984326 /NCGR_PEP_ID=MMETSP0004_2-20121128/17661_1 /TAXON_ID=420556 /ORGANISM="Ochromonas sp., Strain CCMP1393" /LENGTH=216 /DNA_ID=CAMNT_0016236725 /DNA_START=188 /DNA_END=838 /DNA_ORIENTATION=+
MFIYSLFILSLMYLQVNSFTFSRRNQFKIGIFSDRTRTELSARRSNFGQASASDLALEPEVEEINSDCRGGCYFDKASPCPEHGTCPYDNRPCKSNRNYFDEIFGPSPDQMIDPASATGNRKNNEKDGNDRSNNDDNFMLTQQDCLSRLTARERRLRRQKLFLMSTWLEDLLPDPTQGRSWMFNMLVDSVKITFRAFLVLLSMTHAVEKPRIVQQY